MIIGYDGFDHYNTTADAQARSGSMQYPTMNGIFGTPGRGGFGKQYEPDSVSGTFFYCGFSVPTTKITAGFAFNFNGVSGNINVILMDELPSGGTQCSWNISSTTGIISFTDANGNVVATALNAIGPQGWYFIELQNNIGPATGAAGSTGSAAVRVNGQPLASFPDTTGLDTQKTARNSLSAVGFNGAIDGVYMDDLYFCDGTTGPGTYPCNSFLGDVRDSTQFAVGNAGTINWSPLANTNWQEISETAFDGDATYNRSNTINAIDLFNPQVLNTDINQVICLAVTIAVRLEDAGARLIAPCIEIGSTIYVGTPQAVDLSYLYLTSYWPINPATSASWTVSDVNDSHFGYKIVA